MKTEILNPIEHHSVETQEFFQNSTIENVEVKDIETIKEEIKNLENQKQELQTQIDSVRNQLGLSSNIHDEIPSIKHIEDEIKKLLKEQIKTSSNYAGDWTLLLKNRMLDPLTKEKFIETRARAMLDMKLGKIPEQSQDGLNYIKKTQYQEYYQNQIDEYDANVEQIFDSTQIGKALDFNKQPHNLGVGSIGSEGAVFTDSINMNGEPLTIRQKNIIEAHEKGHGLRDFVAEDKRDFMRVIDMDIINQNDVETGKRNRKYLGDAEEIAERMAQLKNYFGFTASDIFTKEHLEYAKQHYVKDTGLDNSMTLFFDAVTEKTVDTFIEVINQYPL
jgi:hypothetical protein